MDILQAIGSTSMGRLRRVVPRNGAAIFAKLEWENPTGSTKDRMANAVISRAEADGRLQVAERLGPYARVATLMCDSGLKSLNTDVYRNR